MSRKSLLISLSGFDGVGKSTQVKLLSKYFKNRNKKVLVTESMFGYYLLKPLVKILRKTTKSPSGGPVSKNKNLLPKAWFLLAFIDIWIGYIFDIKPKLKKYDYTIADRFYTDIWANLLYYGYLPKWGFNLLLRFLPKADISFILYTDPKIVLKREKEFPDNYYISQAKIYKNLSENINAFLVNANQIPSKVSNDIKKNFRLR